MSQRILIIGNGFDLSHGYKTDYNSFIQNIFQESLLDSNLNKDLFRFENKDNSGFSNDQMRIKSINKYIMPQSGFFRQIISEIENKNWSDIEEVFFKTLLYTSEGSIKKLNKEFEAIKNRLEKYLINNVKYDKAIPSYSDFFLNNNIKGTIILNFNYTQTIQKLYNNETSECEVINIHGELNNVNNPIIFGYAASVEDNNLLLEKNNNEYLVNIKSYNYKRTNIETVLKKIYDMSQYDITELYLLGHSCSLSDGNILNQLFNLSDLEKINILYYKNFENYRDTVINIHRVMASDLNYGSIVDFQDSVVAPQFDD